jgi:hypothetical protein
VVVVVVVAAGLCGTGVAPRLDHFTSLDLMLVLVCPALIFLLKTLGVAFSLFVFFCCSRAVVVGTGAHALFLLDCMRKRLLLASPALYPPCLANLSPLCYVFLC